MWLNTGMKSLHKIISEVSLLEAGTNTTAAQNAQVAANVANLKPRYRLTSESKSILHPISKKKVKLRRILHQDKGIGYGGWIEKTENLDITQKSTAWIEADSMVFDNARVEGSADIVGLSIIFGDAKIFGDAVVEGSEYGKCAISTGSFDSNITDEIKIGGIDKSKFVQWAVQLNNSFGGDWQSLLINNDDYQYIINTDANGVYVSKKFKDPESSRQVNIWQIKRKSDDKLGGWIQDDDNLSEQAWVSENAIVIGQAKVFGSSIVGVDKVSAKPTVISGNATIKDSAKIGDNVKIFGDAVISGSTKVGNGAIVSTGTHKDTTINAKADVTIDAADWIDKLNKDKESNYSIAFKNGKPVSAKIKDPISDRDVTVYQIENKKTKVLGGFIQSPENLSEKGWIEVDGTVFGNAKVFGDAVVQKHAMVFGDAVISGSTKVGMGAKVSSGTHKDVNIANDAVIGVMDRDAIIENLRSYPKATGKKYTFTGKKKTVKNLSKKKGLVKTVASKLGVGSEDLEDGAMVTVYQIKRISDGSLGGWVQRKNNEKDDKKNINTILNLSQEGRSWLTEDAVAYGNAIITGDALVIGNSVIYDDAVIEGLNTVVSDSKIGGSTVIKNKDIDGVTVAKMGALKKAAIGAVAGAAYAQSKGLLF